ncbi:hypothetical protein GCM10010967_53240 [Dyadobacter beijingensis]|uniref:Uncharacterized protein n=1 Tax=Dyadobacter beijingensis TaxID=365489 RepID=A0ABQ2IGS2_9BACT|nr:hypothetical protein [Dyadobacter beijingensis]GGN10709.1 hypothetical protein GCM10010967_53240 [Dyadobacter beijingensis]
MKTVDWFKQNVERHLTEYEIEYKSFVNGDFGNLDQVAFNSTTKGGEIDFWSSGYINIHFVDYVLGEELINAFLSPNQNKETEKIFKELLNLI